jgi:hypothetical protein
MQNRTHAALGNQLLIEIFLASIALTIGFAPYTPALEN